MTVTAASARLLAVGLGMLTACSNGAPAATRSNSPGAFESGVATSRDPSATAGSPLRTGAIDPRFTTRTLDYTSTGQYLIWSSGARNGATAPGAPDLFGSRPGEEANLLYDNPNRDSQLRPIAGDGDQFAFIEENFRVFGYGGWKLWYIAKAGAPAVEIDRGVMNVIPGVAIGGRWLVWTPGSREASQLVVLDLTTMARRVLRSSAPDTTQYWHPAISGDKLVYGTVEFAPDGQSDERHIYLENLTRTEAPQRLDQSTSASEPAIDGQNIVWKESDPRLNFDVSGGLVRYSLFSGQHGTVSLRPGPPPTIDGYGAGFMQPTLGGGYVAAWTDGFDGDRVLTLATLRDGDLRTIVDLGAVKASPHDVVVRPELRDSLLAYVFAPAHGEVELRWVFL